MLTDTHCHLDFDKFEADREAVLQRAWDAELNRILIPALDLESSHAALRLAETDPRIFAAVGFHPTDLEKWKDSSIDDLQTLLLGSSSLPRMREQTSTSKSKIVAI